MDGCYVALGGQQQGPFHYDTLCNLGLLPETLVWREGMPEWVPAGTQPALAGLFVGASPVMPGYAQASYPAAPVMSIAQVNSSRIGAGLCGIFLGAFGIHKFILGFGGTGVIMLLATICTCGLAGAVMGVIGLIEGIIYLSHTDQSFYQRYYVERRSWF